MTLEHNLCSRVYWGGRRPSMDGHLNRVGGHNSRPPIHGLKKAGAPMGAPLSQYGSGAHVALA